MRTSLWFHPQPLKSGGLNPQSPAPARGELGERHIQANHHLPNHGGLSPPGVHKLPTDKTSRLFILWCATAGIGRGKPAAAAAGPAAVIQLHKRRKSTAAAAAAELLAMPAPLKEGLAATPTVREEGEAGQEAQQAVKRKGRCKRQEPEPAHGGQEEGEAVQVEAAVVKKGGRRRAPDQLPCEDPSPKMLARLCRGMLSCLLLPVGGAVPPAALGLWGRAGTGLRWVILWG